jgi:integrase
MSRIALKFGAWPEADRALWHRITVQSCPLDDQGAGANWAVETKRVVARDYGYWLSFVFAEEPSAETERPTARITPERVRRYCQSMENVCALTRASRIARLLNFVRGTEPAHDWTWLSKMRRALEKSARRNGPVRKKHGRIVSTGRIIDAGILLMQQADANDGRKIAVRARDFRDGLMLALLAARPLRLKNFTALRLGVHLRSTSNGYLIDIPGNETKTGSPIETFVPERLCPWLSLYLRNYRPVLLKDRHSDFLWVHPNDACYRPGALSMRISKLTARTVGVAISPHLFRDCAATTVATDDPEHVLIIASILGHTSLRTAENHYNQAKGLDANRRLQACIKRLRGKALRR